MSSDMKFETVPVARSIEAASVSGGGGGRPFADLIEEIEVAAPELAEARGVSSAAMRAGALIRSMRKGASLSQTDLAARMRVSQARVSELEAGLGSQGPTWDVMERVAALCGTRLGSFIEKPARAFYTEQVVKTLVDRGLSRTDVHVTEVDGRACVAIDFFVGNQSSSSSEDVRVIMEPIAASCI